MRFIYLFIFDHEFMRLMWVLKELSREHQLVFSGEKESKKRSHFHSTMFIFW